MASSENLATMEPWLFRTMLSEPWLSDSDPLSKALHHSLSDHSGSAVSDSLSPFLPALNTDTPSVHTPCGSGASSDHETAATTITTKRRNPSVAGPSSGRITKRKSRATKRNTTTFITADPANFRHMVQQVTGVRFPGNGHLPISPLVKPEPKRAAGSRLQGWLPTLDTSAFFLGHQQQILNPTSASAAPATTVAQPSDSPPPPAMPVPDGGAPAFDFESFPVFPTLESWKVM